MSAACGGDEPPAERKPPPAADHTLTVIEGKPRERGRQYGRQFRDGIHAFLENEIYLAFTPAGEEVKVHPQCHRMAELLEGSRGRLDRPTLQGFFGDHQSTICKHPRTLGAMLFNTTTREAFVSRGPGCSGRWRRFTFEPGTPS